MSFEFKCPQCNYTITESDFSKNAKILSNLKEIFDHHKQEYLNIIRNSLIDEFNDKQKSELAKILAQKENELNKIKNEELKQLNEIINQQKIALSTSKINLEKILVEKENQLNKLNQAKIDDLKLNIAKLNSLIDNNKSELAKILAQKENEFNKIKSAELTQLNEIINQQNMKLNSNKLNFEKLLIEKENQLILKEQQLIAKKEAEIKVLSSQIEELKIANVQFKVIQNKNKGETFEHDVEAELRKTFEPNDIITKITSQDKKADYLHEIRQENTIIGKIVYEVKNAEWSNAWERKLIEDMAKQDSKYGILIATSFNKKYPGIPFKRSDNNPNIYLSDADSFYFVGQIISSLIKIEFKLESQRGNSSYDEKIKLFSNWKDQQLPKLNKIFTDSFTRIKDSEGSILKRVDDIRIAREKMYNNWLHDMKDFLENFSF